MTSIWCWKPTPRSCQCCRGRGCSLPASPGVHLCWCLMPKGQSTRRRGQDCRRPARPSASRIHRPCWTPTALCCWLGTRPCSHRLALGGVRPCSMRTIGLSHSGFPHAKLCRFLPKRPRYAPPISIGGAAW